MKTLDKLVLRSYIGPMVLAFFIVMFVLMMQFMWRYIDELVGKGLSMGVIMELMFYASLTLIHVGLPLSTLFAAIMTMGNLGENYELLAMKSAGISLPRILMPLVILVFFVSVGSFFAGNNLVPYAQTKIMALIYDIRQQKQTIEFKDGIFFNGIDNMSIRVGKQEGKTKLLTDLLIYDTRDVYTTGMMTTTVADSGYIRISDDKHFLLVTLYHGETYEFSRGYNWYSSSTLRRHMFDLQNGIIPLSGFDFERTDMSLFSGSQTKNIYGLTEGIDSLRNLSNQMVAESYGKMLQDHVFIHDREYLNDSVPKKADRPTIDVRRVIDSLDMRDRADIFHAAIRNAQDVKNLYSFDETTSKDVLTELYKYQVEWHRKLALPVSIMIFFLIGAPLGAIIRKGGLGTPIVVSVLFFVVYYIITITGEKMAKEGTWDAYWGMWIATLILLPISVYLTYKATNDSNLLNSEWYLIRIKKAKEFLRKFKKSNKAVN